MAETDRDEERKKRYGEHRSSFEVVSGFSRTKLLKNAAAPVRLGESSPANHERC